VLIQKEKIVIIMMDVVDASLWNIIILKVYLIQQDGNVLLKKKMAQKLIRFIEIEEFKKVLKSEKDRKFKLAYVLGFGSGLRISEIVGPAKNSNQNIKALTREQVNLMKHQIKVFGKGAKERITMTSPWLNETNIKLLPLKINRRTLQDRFSKLCNKVLGRKLNFHTLRHGWANYLSNDAPIDKRVSMPVLQVLGGWSRLDTVGIYAKANPTTAIKSGYEAF